MRRHLIVGAVLVAVVAAAVGATMAFAGGDPIPTCVAGAACPSYRVDWQLGPPDAFQYDANQVVGEATIVGLGPGSAARSTFDIYAYNWGVGLTSVSLPGGGGGGGRPENQDFTIVRYIDELTPLLAVSCETGEHLPSVTVVVRSKTGTMTYELVDATCALDKHGADGSQNSVPLEQYTMSYRQIVWIFSPKGGPDVRRCFNVTTNAANC